ncbi:MAG: nucleotidyltransferase family protein [Hormoscilla sp.]
MAVQELADTQAAILAGGMGTRLRSVVADRPKVLAKVGDRPFLAYLLDRLAAAGIAEVVLCIGYLGTQVQTTFGDTYKNLNLVYSQESSPLGTAGALRLALPLLKSESVLVMNGDSFCDVSFQEFWARHCIKKAEVTLALTKVPDTRRYGRVQVDTDGKVLSFEEKGNSSGAGWINAGIYLLQRQQLSEIPSTGSVSLEREMLPTWIRTGVYSYQANGRFIDIGTPESYAQAEEFFGVNDRG